MTVELPNSYTKSECRFGLPKPKGVLGRQPGNHPSRNVPLTIDIVTLLEKQVIVCLLVAEGTRSKWRGPSSLVAMKGTEIVAFACQSAEFDADITSRMHLLTTHVPLLDLGMISCKLDHAAPAMSNQPPEKQHASYAEQKSSCEVIPIEFCNAKRHHAAKQP
eukprot:3387437-Amphidinium_carterae.1